MAAYFGQAGQLSVAPAPQRRFQGLCQCQIIARRYQGIEQGHDVAHLGQLNQRGFLGDLAGHAPRAQGLAHAAEAVALARQHHDVLRRQPLRDVGGDVLVTLLRVAGERGCDVLGERGHRGTQHQEGYEGGAGHEPLPWKA